MPAGVDLRPAAGLAVGGVGVPAAPALVGRVADAVDGQGADPAAGAAGVERVDADDERAADGEGVAVDGLPVAAGVLVAHHVGRGVAAGDVGAAAVDVGLVLAVDVERVGVVAGNVHGAGAGALGRARAVAAEGRAVHLAAVRGAATALVRRVAHGDVVRRATSAAALVGAAAPAQSGRVAVAAVEALQQVVGVGVAEVDPRARVGDRGQALALERGLRAGGDLHEVAVAGHLDLELGVAVAAALEAERLEVVVAGGERLQLEEDVAPDVVHVVVVVVHLALEVRGVLDAVEADVAARAVVGVEAEVVRRLAEHLDVGVE